MKQRGQSLIEMAVALGILSLLLAALLPLLATYFEDARLLGATRVFKGCFRRARSIAARSGVQTAIRFEQRPDGVYYGLFADGNYNGVLSRDIRRGIDRLVEGPYRLDAGAPGVRVAIIPGMPAPPPARGRLDPADPVRFGRSNMLSFSPLGTATPGTFYLATRRTQGAVRVTGSTARVRVMICRGHVWESRR
jgi:prepilin-type N-terminal cleavage/methylation domain-containing protein